MARELAAVYSQVFGLSVDVTLAAYCDPLFLDRKELTAIKRIVSQLSAFLLPSLHAQNFELSASGLSLELEHLIVNLGGFLDRLFHFLDGGDRGADYFRFLHQPEEGACRRHAHLELEFYGGYGIALSMNLLNDVELHLKKLNSVFYCTSATRALVFLSRVFEFLGRLRGISPVPSPDVYILNAPCLRCYSEQLLLPNQGETLETMSLETTCDHVCKTVDHEPIAGLFENELGHKGLLPIGSGEDASPNRRGDPGRFEGREGGMTEALKDLDRHTIFQRVDSELAELSTLLYWNSGSSRDIPSESDAPSELSLLARHDRKMRDYRRRLFEGEQPRHACDLFTLQGLDGLFAGGLFNSCSDTIEALKKDCSTTFFQRTNFQSVCQKQNELFLRLSELLKRNCKRDDRPSRDEDEKERIEPECRNAQVHTDAKVRRDNYVKKVARDGMNKLKACIATHEATISDLLSLRVWGSLVYDVLADLMNHFLARRELLTMVTWVDLSRETEALFNSSKFMKNALYQQKLSPEHLDTLTLEFYKLITGPLSGARDLFPLPKNVLLSCCLDTAGVLPHHKLTLTELIWPSMTARDWIDVQFNEFFQIRCDDLNSTQRRIWSYIREAVLSVALYNITWEKKLSLIEPHRRSHGGPEVGLYLTYEETAPLILCGENGRGWIFKDLYAALYHHLQL